MGDAIVRTPPEAGVSAESTRTSSRGVGRHSGGPGWPWTRVTDSRRVGGAGLYLFAGAGGRLRRRERVGPTRRIACAGPLRRPGASSRGAGGAGCVTAAARRALRVAREAALRERARLRYASVGAGRSGS